MDDFRDGVVVSAVQQILAANGGVKLLASGTAGSLSIDVGWSLIFGSMSPTTTTDNYPVYHIKDSGSDGTVQVTGFGADPGQTGWAARFVVGSTVNLAANATGYSYSAGTATWTWAGSPFGFSDGVAFTARIT